MRNVSEQRVEQVFTQALGLGPGERRDAFILSACGEDTALRERVNELFRFHDNAGRFISSERSLRAAELRSGATGEAIGVSEGTVIGRYKLLEQIGEGGFGVVFMAEQEEPVRRKVALKIIKAGMDTKQVIARFEAERQALALMDHPNIAKVHDAGATRNGRSYFVMELVRGIPITKFCEENQLTLKERIELFIPVCQAIQHAHQKGVIHRDIKPGNGTAR